MIFKTCSTLLCIFFTCQSIDGFNRLFMCTYKHHLINIKLQCKSGSKINIVDGWLFESNETYACTKSNSATEPEKRHRCPLWKAMWHKILLGCVAESDCNIPLFPERFPNDKPYGIEIEYNCLSDGAFLQFCHQRSDPKPFNGYPNGINLFFKSGESTSKLCSCDVETNVQIGTLLTIFPTKSMNLTVKSGGKETLYDNEVLIKKSIPNGNNTGKQKKTFVVDYATKPDDAVPFILLHFSIPAKHGHISIRCRQENNITEQLLSSPPPTVNTPTHNYQTPETTNIIGYVITATVTAMSTILIIVIIFVLVKKKQGTKPNKKDVLPTSPKKCTRNMQASFSVTCSDSHSYADIGSISDYRHYVMPDETSQQSFKMKICLENVRDSKDNDRRKLNEDAIAQRKQKTLPKAENANKVDSVINNAVKDIDIVTKKNKDEDSTAGMHLRNKVEQEQHLPEIRDKSKVRVSGDKHNLENDNRKISREHYDPSGYLDLDIAEKTSHQYLQKWMKEFYAVEQKAKLEDKQRKDTEAPQVGKRKVFIAKTPGRESNNLYSNVGDHRIAFSDEESLFSNQL